MVGKNNAKFWRNCSKLHRWKGLEQTPIFIVDFIFIYDD